MTTPSTVKKQRVDAADSLAYVEGLLGGWTSPKLTSATSVKPSPFGTVRNEDEDDVYHQPDTVMTPAPKLSRASTPVMSNQKEKALVVPMTNPRALTPATREKLTVPRPLLPQDEVYATEQYHNATLLYRQRMVEASEESNRMIMDGTAPNTSTVASDYCATLQTLAYQQNKVNPEGNVWGLLQGLVRQDLLLSPTEAANATTWVTARVETSPAQLVEEWWQEQEPRRHVLLQWIQQVHERYLSPDATRPLTTNKILSDNPFATTQDSLLLKHSLQLLLAGRLEDARELARQSQAAWRAAAWAGGQILNEEKQSGNPCRPLWKRQMFRYSQDAGANVDDVAMAALFSDNLETALHCKSLQSYEQRLYALLSFLVGRRQDALLYAQNEARRRQARRHYAGTDYETDERAQLMENAQYSDLDEARAVSMLPTDDPFHHAASAFIGGQLDVEAYVHEHAHPDMGEVDELRFLAHLAIFLDLLPDAAIQGLEDWKINTVAAYIKHMSTHTDEMWSYIVLYASFLPRDLRAQWLPELLGGIAEDDRRELLVSQMRELLEDDEDLFVLQSLFETLLEERDSSSSTDTATKLDTEKMRSLLWFSFHNDHAVPATVATNELLRHFLLTDKLASAFMLVDDFRPATCDALTSGQLDAQDVLRVTADEMVDDDVQQRHEDEMLVAVVEHKDLVMALQAYRAYIDWQEAVQGASPKTRLVDDYGFHSDRLNETELKVANKMRLCDFKREKKASMQEVVEAALMAQEQLTAVLKYDGGWMKVSTKEHDSMREGERQGDIRKLRQKMLPAFVSQYCDVCVDTAEWMELSLQDYAETCDSSQSSGVHEFKSLIVDPKAWLRKALLLAEMIASDSYALASAMHKDDLALILRRLADVDMALK